MIGRAFFRAYPLGWAWASVVLLGCGEEDRYWVPLGADARTFAVEATSIDPWYDDFGDTVVPFPVYADNFVESGGEVDRLGTRYFFDSLYLDVRAWTVPLGNDLSDGKKDYVRVRFGQQPDGPVWLESVFQLFPTFRDSLNAEFSADTLRWNDRAFYRVYRLSDPSQSRMQALIDSTGQLLGFQTIDSLIYFREAP
ncbi:hypothetical protein GC167_09480 [bacterium]|nr:hypothetical protein [bacterium]